MVTMVRRKTGRTKWSEGGPRSLRSLYSVRRKRLWEEAFVYSAVYAAVYAAYFTHSETGEGIPPQTR